jgi:hypothetical protein
VPADESVLEKLQRESGIPLPPWMLGVLSILVIAGAILALFKPFWPAMKAFYFSLKKAFAKSRQDQKRAKRRARFADYVEGQMRRLGEKEEWRDNRYAELEAEVEVRPNEKRRWYQIKPRTDEVRRLPSLSDALASVSERIVLLEGDPGSGKSVALRHLAQSMALNVVRNPSEIDPIPLYINLKEFHAGGSVTAVEVRELVLGSINRGRNRDIDRYLEDEFDKGIEDGTWIFLFDSFDEIPAILSAVDASPIVGSYADALYDFLHGLGCCRGIVASREFRGPPRQHDWPRFKVMPLSWKRKVELIGKADLPQSNEQELIEDLRLSSAEMLSLSDNPMFLGLLCEHIRDGHTFPETAHSVIESYVQERFQRDSNRIADIFAVEPDMVRAVAEELSFQIANHQTLGLTVERTAAADLVKDQVHLSEDEILACLDALEYTKLARSANKVSDSTDGRWITFAHRRLQEYFATCVVLRDPTRVKSIDLLTDGRWRETAVTVLQVQDSEDVHDLLECAALILEGMTHPSSGSEVNGDFEWLPGQYHVLQVLADGGGFAKYPNSLTSLPRLVDRSLKTAWSSESRKYRKWVLEVCAAATPESASHFIREAFQGDSSWLREEAYSQVRRVRQASSEIEQEVRQTLLDFSISGELRRSRQSIRTQLSRTSNPTKLLQAVDLLLLVPVLDAILGIVAVSLQFRIFLVISTAALFVGSIWLVTGVLMRATFVRPSGNRSRWMSGMRRIVGDMKLRPRGSSARKHKDRKLSKSMLTFLVFTRVLYVNILAVLVMTLSVTPSSIGYLLLSVAVTVASCLWLLGALMAVKKGVWLRPFQRIFLFALPIYLACKYFYSLEFRTATWNFVRAIPKAILPALLGAGIVSGLAWLVVHYSDTVKNFLIVFAILAGIPTVIRFARAIHSSVHDTQVANVSELGESITIKGEWLAFKASGWRLSCSPFDPLLALLRCYATFGR